MLSRLEQYSTTEFMRRLTEDSPSGYIPYGFTQVRVPGGADSPFLSLEFCLAEVCNINISASKLRPLLVNEITSNPSKYGLAGNAKQLEKIRGMQRPGIATYVIIFQAAANYFQVNCVLYFGFEQPLVFAPKQRKNAVNVRDYPSLFILCLGQGCHFDPLSRFDLPINLQNCHLLEFDPFDLPDYESDSSDELSYYLDNHFTINDIIEITKPCPIQNPEDLANITCISAMNPLFSVSESAISYAYNYCETSKNFITIRFPRFRSQESCPVTDSKSHFCGELRYKLRKPLKVFSTVSRGAEIRGDGCADSAKAQFFSDSTTSFDELFLCISIDTGSTISLVSETAYGILYNEGFAEKKLPLKKGHGKITTIDGTITSKEIVLLTIPFWSPGTGHSASHLFYILPDKYCLSCLLFGADFMSSYDVKMTYDRSFSNKDLPYIDKQVDDCTMSLQYPIVKESTTSLHSCSLIYASWPYQLMACSILLPSTGQIPDAIRLDFDFVKDLLELNKRDMELKPVIKAVKKCDKTLCPELYKPFFPKLVILEGLLFYNHKNNEEIPIMPTKWIIDMVTDIHNDFNHLGSAKLWLMMKTMYWHPRMRELINEICRTCPLCQIMKAYTSIKTPPLHKVVTQRPFDLVCMDVLTLPKTHRGNNYVLVLADHCSKFLVTFPMKNHTTDTIINFLDQYLMSVPSCVKTLLTDAAPEMASDKFKQFCNKRDIYHLFSSPYIARTNGFAERNCGIVIQHLKLVLNSIQNWDQQLYKIVAVHNNSPSLPTLLSPNEFLLTKPHVKTPEGILAPKIAAKWREGHPLFHPYTIGSEVLLRKHYLGNIATNKLKIKYGGIYKISNVRSNGLIYDLEHIVNKNDRLVNIHYIELRPYFRPSTYLLECSKFKAKYNEWYNIAFYNQSDRLKPVPVTKTPCVQEAPVQKTQIPIFDTRTLVKNSVQEVNDSSSISEEESYQQYLQYQRELQQNIFDHDSQYQQYIEKYHYINPDPHIIPLIPKSAFLPNVVDTINKLRTVYCDNDLYSGDNSRKWEPSNQGPLLTIRTIQCFDQNILDAQFSYPDYIDRFRNTISGHILQSLALSITYNCVTLLENYESYLLGPLSDSESSHDVAYSSSSSSPPDSDQDNISHPASPCVLPAMERASLLGASEIDSSHTGVGADGVGWGGSGSISSSSQGQNNIEQSNMDQTDQVCTDITEILENTNVNQVRAAVSRLTNEMDLITAEVNRDLNATLQNSHAVRASIREEVVLTDQIVNQTLRVRERQYDVVEWLGQIEQAMTIDFNSRRVRFTQVGSTHSSLNRQTASSNSESTVTSSAQRRATAINRPFPPLPAHATPNVTPEPVQNIAQASPPIETNQINESINPINPETIQTVDQMDHSAPVSETESQAERNAELSDIAIHHDQQTTFSTPSVHRRLEELVAELENQVQGLEPIIERTRRSLLIAAPKTSVTAEINQLTNNNASTNDNAAEIQPINSLLQRPSTPFDACSSPHASSHSTSSAVASHPTASRNGAERVDISNAEPYFTDQPVLDVVNIGGHNLRLRCSNCPFQIASCHCICKNCKEWTSKCICEF